MKRFDIMLLGVGATCVIISAITYDRIAGLEGIITLCSAAIVNAIYSIKDKS